MPNPAATAYYRSSIQFSVEERARITRLQEKGVTQKEIFVTGLELLEKKLGNKKNK